MAAQFREIAAEVDRLQAQADKAKVHPELESADELIREVFRQR